MNRLSAQDIIAQTERSRRMIPAPTTYFGTLQDLATTYVLPNLIAPARVEQFHRSLVEYLNESDPVFLVRAVSTTERGQIYRTREGSLFKATDNAPAWWVHFALFHEIDLSASSFASVIETIPTHFFEVARQIPESVSSAGWHVAHIFSVKDRNVTHREWRKPDLVQRFVRNIHPCNYFFIPKTDWQRWGGDERIISYFANFFAQHYGTVWSEFASLAGGELQKLAKITGNIEYQIGGSPAKQVAKINGSALPQTAHQASSGQPVVRYSSSRFAFKADLIEPLEETERFRIDTPEGAYEMSKAEFYAAFPRVVETKSYKIDRLYHYPKVPLVALRFRVPSEQDSATG